MINSIQFQKGLSLAEFMVQYGTEAQCEAALIVARWPEGFVCPRCGHRHGYAFRHGKNAVWQCRACPHQTSLRSGTLMEHSRLSLRTWMLAIYLITQSKTNIAALALRRQLGISWKAAWLLKHKIMEALRQREAPRLLSGDVRVDDAYLGGERTGGKVGRGSENKIPFVAAVSLSEAGRPIRVRLTPVAGFTLKAISAWAKGHLAPTSTVFSDGLACFGAVTEAGCSHRPTVMAGRKPKEVPEFRWINTVLGNLKTSLSGCYHAFDFKKYAARYLAAFSYRFNRRFDLRTLHQRLIIAAASTPPHPMRVIRVADVHC